MKKDNPMARNCLFIVLSKSKKCSDGDIVQFSYVYGLNAILISHKENKIYKCQQK